ncbi:MAG: LLM class flavin-dependent oxidoreductase [Chloroflexota bacterium]
MELRVGLQSLTQGDFRGLLRLWREAEAADLDSAWLFDHLVPPYNPSGPCLEAWTLLAALLAGTRRIHGGVLVSNVCFRRPAMLAAAARTAMALSGGRLEVGLGAGWYRPEHARLGLAFPAYPVRLGLLEQHTIALGPGFRPWLGGNGRQIRALAERHGTGWNLANLPVPDMLARAGGFRGPLSLTVRDLPSPDALERLPPGCLLIVSRRFSRPEEELSALARLTRA